MRIDTIVFGPVEVPEDKIFHMSKGPLGFEDTTDYALVEKQDQDVVLRWFQAVDTTVPCFVVFNPFEIVNGYEPVVEPHDLRALECDGVDELDYLVIAVISEDISKSTVNLKSPIVINREKHTAGQVILRNDYPIRFSLVQSEGAPAVDNMVG